MRLKSWFKTKKPEPVGAGVTTTGTAESATDVPCTVGAVCAIAEEETKASAKETAQREAHCRIVFIAISRKNSQKRA